MNFDRDLFTIFVACFVAGLLLLIADLACTSDRPEDRRRLFRKACSLGFGAGFATFLLAAISVWIFTKKGNEDLTLQIAGGLGGGMAFIFFSLTLSRGEDIAAALLVPVDFCLIMLIVFGMIPSLHKDSVVRLAYSYAIAGSVMFACFCVYFCVPCADRCIKKCVSLVNEVIGPSFAIAFSAFALSYGANDTKRWLEPHWSLYWQPLAATLILCVIKLFVEWGLSSSSHGFQRVEEQPQ